MPTSFQKKKVEKETPNGLIVIIVWLEEQEQLLYWVVGEHSIFPFEDCPNTFAVQTRSSLYMKAPSFTVQKNILYILYSGLI